MPEKSTETLTKLIELLAPLSEEDRKKTVEAATIFLKSTSVNPQERPRGEDDEGDEKSEGTNLSRKAANWLKQNSLELKVLEDVFHFSDGDVEIIAADVPGTGARTKTQHCYLLVGLKNMLQNGEATIADDEARKLCQELGCYDSPNHSKAVKDLGNFVNGSKANGFVLTTPGLRAAAELLKQLTAPAT